MNTQRSFGSSAFITDLHSTASRSSVEKEVTKLLAILGQHNPAIASKLAEAEVPSAALEELAQWNAVLNPNPHRDRLGKEAARFFAAQTLVSTVLWPLALDLKANHPPEVALAMQAGADGLFDLGKSQFDALARLLRDLTEWISIKKFRSIALVECPLGNTVPVQALSDLLLQKGVSVSTIVWKAPRNDRPSRGRTITESARICAASLVLGDESDLAVTLVEALDREFPVHDRDHDALVPRRFRAVDDEQVAVVNVRIVQAIPLHMGEERRGGMLDEMFMQVELFLEVIVRRRGKAGRDALREIRDAARAGPGRGDEQQGGMDGSVYRPGLGLGH